MADQKQWWAPVWKGLIMDQEARYYQKMKNAIWLFLYLLLNADRKTGFLVRKVRTISSDTGIKRDTVLRWLNTLREGGYISTQNTGRCLAIQIKKWKPLPAVRKIQNQKLQIFSSRSWRKPTSPETLQGQNSLNLSRELTSPSEPNDITIKKEILNNDIDNENFLDSNRRAFRGFRPRNKQELLALDLAEALNDHQGLPLYLRSLGNIPNPF